MTGPRQQLLAFCEFRPIPLNTDDNLLYYTTDDTTSGIACHTYTHHLEHLYLYHHLCIIVCLPRFLCNTRSVSLFLPIGFEKEARPHHLILLFFQCVQISTLIEGTADSHARVPRKNYRLLVQEERRFLVSGG